MSEHRRNKTRFALVFILGKTVLFLDLQIFFSAFKYLPFLRSPSRGPAIYVFLV